MITEQLILSLYAVLLLEVGLLLLILILIVVDIKNTIESINRLIHKFLNLGHFTADTAEALKSKLSSISNITNMLAFIPEIMSLVRGWSYTKSNSDSLKKEDELDEALSQVRPKKKKRII